MGWIEKLKDRWKLNSALQVLIVLVVFALTGFTVMFLKRPLFSWIMSDGEEIPLWFSITYYILIFPIYNIILLAYGFLFGQFQFFWEFEKKTFRRFSGKKKVNHEG